MRNPNYGRGVLGGEMNLTKNRKIDKCLPPFIGTEHGLLNVIIKNEVLF